MTGMHWTHFVRCLKRSFNLCSLQLDWLSSLQPKFVAAIRENGCVVVGKGDIISSFEEILYRNKANHARAMASVVCLLAVRRLKRTNIPKEMAETIARMLWTTRCDVGAWRK